MTHTILQLILRLKGQRESRNCFQETFEAREGYEQDNIIHQVKRKEGNDFPARFQSEVFGMAETARSENKSKFFNPRFLVIIATYALSRELALIF